MDFSDRLRKLAERIKDLKEHIHTEEATKQSLVIPFIKELGYDVYNPAEVVPEFTADVGTRRNEKVDYAILKDGVPILLIECKDFDIQLGHEHRSQLTRYFNVTRARYAILTNGIVYQFFTELDEKNQMDATPFLVFNMENLDERMMSELEQFTRDSFDVDRIFSSARELRIMRDLRREIATECREPSTNLVRHFAKQVYSGPLTRARMEEFNRFVREAMRRHVNDLVRSRLESAIKSEAVEHVSGGAGPINLGTENGSDHDGPDGFGVFQYWDLLIANEELHALFAALHDYIESLGEETCVVPTKNDFVVKRSQDAHFNEFYLTPQPRHNRLRLRLRLEPKSIQLEDGFTRDRSNSRDPYKLEVFVHNHYDLERAKPLIRRSYEEAG